MPSNAQKANQMREKLPFASIIVLNYNGKEYLENCFLSLQELDYPKDRFELIIVDNGSTDGSVDFVHHRFSNIKIIQNEKNLGFAGGNNEGIKKSRGDIFILLNNDTTVDKSCLRELIKIMSNDEKMKIGGCKILYPDKKTIQHAGGIILPNGLTNHYGNGEIDTGQYDEVKDVDYVTGAAIAIKRSLLDELGYLDDGYFPIYFEEVEYCYKARKLGYRVIYIPSSIVYHYESMTTKKFSYGFFYKYHKNRLRFILKNYTLLQLLKLFIPYEIKWIKDDRPVDQIKPLIKACMVNLIWLPKTLLDRWRAKNV